MKLRLLVLSSLLLALPWIQGCTSTDTPSRMPCTSCHHTCCKNAQPCEKPEHHDPFEDMNRGTFSVNNALDEVLFDRMAAMYRGVVPDVIREHIGYFLRNLNEPVVLVNNILQGDIEAADNTLARFVANSTVGLGGLFDVSTSLDIPYKTQDFGLTLASWGVEPGPYVMLPLLGPSNARDCAGKLVDFACNPLTWVGVYGPHRTGSQILDAKTENLDLTNDLKNNAVDPYANFRTWYGERRKDLMQNAEDRTAVDTPRPDDDD